jgi:hypothetical protein
LYHFTVLTNQTKAGLLGNGQVSIGYHYVAVDANGNPVDTDGDGMPDYGEDSNGNGLFNVGDLSDWTDPNADADGDGLPDAWEWKYFGNLAQNGSDDYDYDGMSNWHEYLLRSDPNTIRFSISLPKRHVNYSPVPLTLTVLAGVPSSMAVLVDSTNTASALWASYSATVHVPLGPPEGWRELWVGLRGLAPDAEQTWSCVLVYFDRTPPQLVLTNPASRLVSQPIVQLQGYTPEKLKEIAYDWIGPGGAHSNQPVYVVRVIDSWEPQEPTTNFWQGWQVTTLWQVVDVPLVPGTNLIILRARDMADNLTVTNLRFNLDYSRDTSPPVLRLHWPCPGTRIAAESFTCRGWLDDPTATLTAVRVQPPGQPQQYRAVVERDGFFWIYDLPLDNGTNQFLLMATDVAGNVHQTQFWVLRGAERLTIDPISPDQLRHPPLTVTGTCLLTNHTLWVNGVRATVQGSRWVAEGVPLPPGSMAIIQVRAIPNEHNQGQGTGGGTPPTYENLGNPVSPQAQEAETNRPQPWRLFASEDKVRQSMYLFTLSEEYEPGNPPTNVLRWSEAHHWYQSSHSWSNTNRDCPDGTGTGRFYSDSFYLHSDGNSNDPAPCGCDFYWPIPDAPGFAAVTNCECYPWPWVRTPPLISEHCDVSNPEPRGWTNQFEHSRVRGWYRHYHRFAQTR